MIDQNKPYELDYWSKAPPDKVLARYAKAIDTLRLDEFLTECQSVIDLGSGPYGGIFTVRTFPTMVAIDPLWDEYNKRFSHIPQNVITVCGDSLDFRYDGEVEAVFSMNALDHSGNLAATAEEIQRHISPGGVFVLHLHMRTSEQLNAGHKMLITERDIDEAFGGMQRLWKEVVPICPFDNKAYRSYMGAWRKA